MIFSGDASKQGCFIARARRYCPVSKGFLAMGMGKAAGWGGFFLATLLLAARAAPATDAYLAQAQAALDVGDAAHAKRLVDAALGEGPMTPLQRARLLHNRGVAQELMGGHNEALADYTGALGLQVLPSEERAQALLQRGFLLDSLNRWSDAIRDYSSAAALKTSSAATALNNRANIYRRQNRLIEARRDYLAALAAGNARPQFSYYGLGQIAEARKDKEAARGFYARAVLADAGYQLAAGRLAALGGPSDGALMAPAEEVVKLRPPRTVLQKASPGPRLRPSMDGAARPKGIVQLGAFRSEAEARAGWVKAVAAAANGLKGAAPQIAVAELPGKGRLYRLRVSTSRPEALCASLQAAGQGCWRVPH
jgi:tetratricopeptide (TPR) repeat protein